MSRTLYILVLLIATAATAFAQPSDTITANPKAAKLHRIWTLLGPLGERQKVGLGAGSAGDINSDSPGDFAVFFPKPVQWKIYLGHAPAPDTTPVWSFNGNAGGELPSPVIGDFWGTGHQALGFAHDTCNPINAVCLLRIFAYRTESGHLPDTPAAIINTNVQFCTRGSIAADLDGDGADELALVGACYAPEIWIYRGGASFPGATPTMILRDADTTGYRAFSAIVADVDGDRRLDLVTAGNYINGPKLKFYWGSATSPWSWTTPDRVVDFIPSDVYYLSPPLDVDGDHITDLLFANYLFRSATGKNARTRSFSVDDAEQRFLRPNYIYSTSAGHLNDSTRRYDMIGLINNGQDRFDGSAMLLFSGGENGPDAAYDASYRTEDDSLIEGHTFTYIAPLHDCNGDGWDDFLATGPDYPGFDDGIAMVIGGGPQIPQDFATAGVREVAVADRSNGLYLWPNPVVDELNIAWRGDLKRMPERFEIHDMSGQRVAGGIIDPWRGSVIWCSVGVPAGTYMLTAFDSRSEVIATVKVMKQ